MGGRHSNLAKQTKDTDPNLEVVRAQRNGNFAEHTITHIDDKTRSMATSNSHGRGLPALFLHPRLQPFNANDGNLPYLVDLPNALPPLNDRGTAALRARLQPRRRTRGEDTSVREESTRLLNTLECPSAQDNTAALPAAAPSIATTNVLPSTPLQTPPRRQFRLKKKPRSETDANRHPMESLAEIMLADLNAQRLPQQRLPQQQLASIPQAVYLPSIL